MLCRIESIQTGYFWAAACGLALFPFQKHREDGTDDKQHCRSQKEEVYLPVLAISHLRQCGP